MRMKDQIGDISVSVLHKLSESDSIQHITQGSVLSTI